MIKNGMEVHVYDTLYSDFAEKDISMDYTMEITNVEKLINKLADYGYTINQETSPEEFEDTLNEALNKNNLDNEQCGSWGLTCNRVVVY